MTRSILAAALVLIIATVLPTDAAAQHEDAIKSARSAGPASISDDATVLDWNMNVLAEGTNG